MTQNRSQRRLTLVAPALAAVALLAACASPTKPTAGNALAPATTAPATGSTTAAANAQGTAQSQVASVDLTRSNSAASAQASSLSPYVYFDFDSATIRDEFKDTIDGHARKLSSDTNQRLRVAGHTDERGGREYNLALGQKRAEAVSRAMVLLGADANRIEAVSYGEERPKAEGSTEEAWSKNRRAELRAQR